MQRLAGKVAVVGQTRTAALDWGRHHVVNPARFARGAT